MKHLLLKNAKVYLASRSPTRCADAAKQLKEETGREPFVLNLDLADLKSVREAAEEFLAKEDRLDILFNNAWVGAAVCGCAALTFGVCGYIAVLWPRLRIS